MKTCFDCKRPWPLFFYKKTKVAHLIRMKSSQGRGFLCCLCSFKKRLAYPMENIIRLIGERDEYAKENKKLKRQIAKMEVAYDVQTVRIDEIINEVRH